MSLSSPQLDRLTRVHDLVESILVEHGALPSSEEAPRPQWMIEEEKRWRLLKAVELRDKDIGADEWSQLGMEHGYDPRGLGGFFQGSQPSMAKQGARRVLTTHGERFIERWEPDFGPYKS
jgi:hypothetical protein